MLRHFAGYVGLRTIKIGLEHELFEALAKHAVWPDFRFPSVRRV